VGTAHLLHEKLFAVTKQPAPPYLVEFDRRFCTVVDTLIAVSDFLANQIIELGIREDRSIEVIRNGVSSQMKTRGDVATPSIEYASINGSTRRNILYVGRLVPQKGALQLLESAVKVVERFADVRYLLVGARYDPIFVERLESFVSEHRSVAAATTLVGAVPHRSLLELYQTSYLAVLPSLYESFGLSAVEAMINGIPVVASNVGGLREVIIDNESGLLVPITQEDDRVVLDPEHLADAQIKVLEDPVFASRLGSSGQRRALQIFSDTAMAAHTLDCYRRTISRHSRRCKSTSV
jgi:glycosyltransferase involved in cell wall biosynthesis